MGERRLASGLRKLIVRRFRESDNSRWAALQRAQQAAPLRSLLRQCVWAKKAGASSRTPHDRAIVPFGVWRLAAALPALEKARVARASVDCPRFSGRSMLPLTGYCYGNTIGRRKREQAPALHMTTPLFHLECGGLPPLCRRKLQEICPPTRSFLRVKRRPLQTCTHVQPKLFDILLRYSLTRKIRENSAAGAAANKLGAGKSVGVCVTTANSVPQRLKPQGFCIICGTTKVVP
jgi:hypothetical protein